RRVLFRSVRLGAGVVTLSLELADTGDECRHILAGVRDEPGVVVAGDTRLAVQVRATFEVLVRIEHGPAEQVDVVAHLADVLPPDSAGVDGAEDAVASVVPRPWGGGVGARLDFVKVQLSHRTAPPPQGR